MEEGSSQQRERIDPFHVIRTARLFSPSLHRFAVSFENNAVLRKIRRIDLYGENNGPDGRGRTVFGGCFSAIFISVVVTMIIFSFVQLVQQTRSMTPDTSISINAIDADFYVLGIYPATGKKIDFPVLELLIHNDVLFFEADNPSIQKILLTDNTKFNPDYASAKDDPHTTKSGFAKASIPFNSNQLNVPGSTPPVVLNLDEIILSQLASKFTQETQTMELMKTIRNLYVFDFYPHDVSVYIRFKREQLLQLLDFQLDVAIYNKGEWETSNRPNVLSSLKTLVTQNTTGYISSLFNSDFNVLVMRNHLDSRTSNTTDTLNWLVGFQYSPNFMYTPNDFYCLNNEKQQMNATDYEVLAWVIPPDYGDTTLQLSKMVNWTLPTSVPFSIMLQDCYAPVTVTVTAVSGNVLTITPPFSKDFRAYADIYYCVYDTVSELLRMLPIPPGLPTSLYSVYYNDIVSVSEWYFAPWCQCYEGIPSIFCVICKTAQEEALSYGATICDIYGNSNKSTFATHLPISIACDQGEPFLIGQTAPLGSYAVETDPNWKLCPEDEYYGGLANMHSDRTTWCNEKPSARLYYIDESEFTYYEIVPRPPYSSPYRNTTFNATLTIAAFNYSVTATYVEHYYWENTVVVGDFPTPQPCGQTLQSVPTKSFGYMLVPLEAGDLVMLFFDDGTKNNYLPQTGPYQIAVTTNPMEIGSPASSWTLTVANAFCPNNEGIQVVLLQDPPPPSFIADVQAYFWVFRASETARRGAREVNVWNINQTIVNLVCEEMHKYEYALLCISSTQLNVINITYGNISCCENNNACPVDTPITFALEHPLALAILEETKIYFVEEDFMPNVNTTPVLNAFPTSKENELVYKTQERYKTFPVPNLDVDVAIFVVPDKVNFDNLTNLCTYQLAAPTFPENATWIPTRNFTIDDCHFIKDPDCAT